MIRIIVLLTISPFLWALYFAKSAVELLCRKSSLLLLIALLSCASCSSLQARLKCGSQGTIDWDPNPDDPPPHCG